MPVGPLMKITFTLKVLAVGALLMAATMPFEYWTPLAALVLLNTLVGALAAYLVENDDSVVAGSVDRTRAA